MNRWFRLGEDGWLLLVLGLLAVFGGLSAVAGYWSFLGLALSFMAPVVVIWFKQASSRWCAQCDQPMEMEKTSGRVHLSQWYRCGQCGYRCRSGVQLEWPE